MPLFGSAPAPTDALLDLPPGAPLVSLRDVEKAYDVGGGKNYVLRRVNIDVRPGEFVTVMGPSGAGKSTVLAILGLLDHAWSGEFEFAGQPVHRLSPRDRTA